MKRIELAFAALLVPLDYLLVFLAAYAAYTVRIGYFSAFRPVVFAIPIGDYLKFSAAASAVFVALFAFAGLYAVSGPRRLRIELSRIFLACSTAIMTVIVLIFFRGELFGSRFIVLAAWLFAIVFVSAGRIAVRLLQRLLLRTGIGSSRVAIIGGDDRTTKLFIEEFSRYPGYGYVIAGRFSAFDADTEKALDGLAKDDAIDTILVADPDAGRGDLEKILAFAEARHLAFKYSADLVSAHGGNVEIMTLAGVPVVEIKGTRLDGWGRIFKRIFDLVGSLILIILTSPIMIATAIAVKLDSKGPVLFSKLEDGSPVLRVGEHGKPFPYFKFRSMVPNAHSLRSSLSHLDTSAGGPLVKIKDDPRVTRVGAFIRKFSIDELPELFLVLAGSMSLVGPRPHLTEEVAKYEDRHRKVLTIKPGITGLAQVSGRRDLSFEEEVRLDTYYIENWSPWLDMLILLKTPLVVLAKKGAY